MMNAEFFILHSSFCVLHLVFTGGHNDSTKNND